ncbi:MAG: CPBP family intramembrane metalloprotease [Deltaproteobacteria bacterium]|nr:CPBP family intramembrane metalloprotease [Deltaproteobacteria bacterium]MBW2360895.1 CPBP family intramembrane metalloprotease [Deltaproteobacteria bacterium]
MGSSPLRDLCIGTLGIEGVLCMVALGAAWLSRRHWIDRLGLAPGTLPARNCALLAIGTVALSLALDGVIEVAGLRAGTPLEEFAQLLAGARGVDLAFALLALGLVPGFAEELLCRGLVQRGLEARLGTAGAVVVAALCFGALHVDPVHGGFAVLLGLYLGVAAARADSIRAAIVCHASNNLLAVYSAAWWPELRPPGPLGIGLAAAISLTCLWCACRPWPARSGLQIRDRSVDS